MKRMIFGCLTQVLIVLLVAAPLEGQRGAAFVSGRVRSEFGEVVVGARIMSARSDVTVHSDSTGRFRLGPLTPGVDTITVYVTGYDEGRPVIMQIRNGQQITRDWVLLEWPIERRDVAALDGPVRIFFYAFRSPDGGITRDSVGFHATTIREYPCIMPLRVAAADTPTGSALYLVGVGAVWGTCAQMISSASGGEVLSMQPDSTTVTIIDQQHSATYVIRRVQRGYCVRTVSATATIQLSVAQDSGGGKLPTTTWPPDTEKLPACP